MIWGKLVLQVWFSSIPLRAMQMLLAACFVLYGWPDCAMGAPTTLEAVRARGHIVCGVRAAVAGFSQTDQRGRWSGFEVDFCRALAAAVLGSKERVQFRAVTNAERYRLLAQGEVDILAAGADFTMSRDTELGVRFVDTLFHDGIVFMVKRSQSVFSALELSGASVCLLDGARGAAEVAGFFESRGMRYQPLPTESWAGAVDAYLSGACTAIAGEMAILAASRLGFADPKEHTLLPELISKEPIGPVVRRGDENWFSIVRWTLMALIRAEELGVNSMNVQSNRSSPSKSLQRLLGVNSDLGQAIGLSRDWAYQAIAQTGNYGELFERNLGGQSPLRLERGLNKLWRDGGLMYALPLR